MRRFTGGLLFFSGLMGLVLVLVFWLPNSINLSIVISVCLLCFGCVWGGGKLLQQPIVRRRAVTDGSVAQPSELGQLTTVCPRCGWLIGSGQRFCGGCGMVVGPVCAQCGALVVPGFRFCTNCGNRLAENG